MAINDAQLPQRTSLTAQIAESGDVLTSMAAAMAAVVGSHTVTVDGVLPRVYPVMNYLDQHLQVIA